MPASLVSGLGLKRELAEFRSVLSDAQNQVLQPVDAETMAQELLQTGGRPFVEMVRELTTSLANTRKALEDANLRYERLTADLARRGIPLVDDRPAGKKRPRKSRRSPAPLPTRVSDSAATTEWDDWNLKFQSLLG